VHAKDLTAYVTLFMQLTLFTCNRHNASVVVTKCMLLLQYMCTYQTLAVVTIHVHLSKH